MPRDEVTSLRERLMMHARDCVRAADMDTDAVLCKRQIDDMADAMAQAAEALSTPHAEGMDGVALIAAERKRQVTAEGWTPEHDDEHDDGAMAFAASVYARIAGSVENDRRFLRSTTPMFWPWARAWLKPGADDTNASRTRELAKAGALIAAEIDRLQRASLPSEPAK